MKYEIYQIVLPHWMHNEINRLGHAEAMEKYSIYRASLESMRGKYEPWMRSMYSLVATIDEAVNLEHVFEIGNIRPEESIRMHQPMHSLSVGDLVRDSRGVWHLCAPIGWQVVFVEEKVAA